MESQLKDQGSFASRLKAMLALRKSLGIAESELVSVPTVTHPGVVIIINKLSEIEGNPQARQITALNFGKASVQQSVTFAGLAGDAKVLWSNLQGAVTEDVVFDNDSLMLDLQPLEAKLIVIYGVSPNG